MLQRRELSLSDLPSVGFAVSTIVGAVASLFIGISDSLALQIAVVAAFIALLGVLYSRAHWLAAVLVYAAVSAFVFLKGTIDVARDERAQLTNLAIDTAIVSCRGVVVWKDETGINSRNERLWLENILVCSPDTYVTFNRLRVRLRIPLSLSSGVQIGDIVVSNVRISSADKIQQQSVRGLFWTLRERLVAEARFVDDQSLTIVSGAPSLSSYVYNARSAIFKVLEEHLRPDARAVTGALLLGSRATFTSEFREELQLTGLAHLFALSGLNTGLLVSLLWVILSLIRIPSLARYILLLVLLIVYAILGLGIPSLFRSAVMASLMVVARLLSRPSHPLNLLLFAAGVELLLWPLHILDAGFHLSYLSMGGILAAHTTLKKPMQDILRTSSNSFGRRVADILSSTIGAQLATAPASSMLFGRVPAFAILANVIAIPLFSLLVVLAIGLLLTSQVSITATSFLARAIEGLVGVFSVVTTSAAAFTSASLSTNIPIIIACLAVIGQIIAIILIFAGRIRSAIIASLVVLNMLLWPNQMFESAVSRIEVLGNEDGTMVYVRAGEVACLIGCGSKWSSYQNTQSLERILKEDSQSEIDVLMIPSRRMSIAGGASDILSVLRPELVLEFGEYDNSQTSDLLDAALLTNRLTLAKAEAGATWEKGNTVMQIDMTPCSSTDVWIVSMFSHTSRFEVIFREDHEYDSEFEISSEVNSFVLSFPPSHEIGSRWVFDGEEWRELNSSARTLIRAMSLPFNENA